MNVFICCFKKALFTYSTAVNFFMISWVLAYNVHPLNTFSLMLLTKHSLNITSLSFLKRSWGIKGEKIIESERWIKKRVIPGNKFLLPVHHFGHWYLLIHPNVKQFFEISTGVTLLQFVGVTSTVKKIQTILASLHPYIIWKESKWHPEATE